MPLDVGRQISDATQQVPEHEAEEAGSRNCLDTLLNHLQGNGPKVSADAGIARLQPTRLAAIQRSASSLSDDCLRDAQSLSRLLAQLIRTGDLAIRTEDLSDLARHIGKLNDEHIRWRQLAENAGMYCRQRDISVAVARHWLQWARHWDEWPQPQGPSNPSS